MMFLLIVCFSHQSMKAPELKEKLHESEKLIQEMTITWEEKLRKTEEIATVCSQKQTLSPFCLTTHMFFFNPR